jgi:hypothetical protein
VYLCVCVCVCVCARARIDIEYDYMYFCPQGVSLEDIEKAEEVLRQGDASKNPTDTTTTTASDTTSARSLRGSQSGVTSPTMTTATTTIPTTMSSTSEREGRTSNLLSQDSLRDETISSSRRRNFENKTEDDKVRDEVTLIFACVRV